MDKRQEQVKAIFSAAASLPARERAVLLDAACRGDDDLRREVESLLSAHEAEGALHIADSASSIASTEFTPLTEKPGMRIGPYKLLQQIGEGGFGAVFMADQERPVRRRVALKIIKLGMDTRQVVARFEAERQALAMMDHPNIARVLDAGATESGRPYFVMELVKGDPITEYSDRNNLSVPERLELFTQVCNAVQHAHTKGVIHRDIKPSNVLVHTQDGKPHAKVIDFGIAKATDQHLTDKTLFTEHKALIGTPAYMSPEQAEGSLDIDTRTDVYALGVLLYELLTGTTPFDIKQLREAAIAEIHRIIREVEPLKPSTRISQSTDNLPTLAARRRTEPKKLGVLIRGELDWIVMKALDKDRARRYETANNLAEDVHRHLSGEPIVAAPPSAAYQVRKFVRKHKGPVATIAATGLTMLVGLALFYMQNVKITRQNIAIEQEKQRADLRAEEAMRARADLAKVYNEAKDALRQIWHETILQKRVTETSFDIDAFLDVVRGDAPTNAPLLSTQEQLLVYSNGLPTTKTKVSNGPDRLNARVVNDGESAESATVQQLIEEALQYARATGKYQELLQAERDQAQQRAREADAAKREALAATERAEFNEYIANIGAADASIKANEWPTARARLDACIPKLRNWEWGVLHRRAETCRFVVKGQFTPILSPDGARMLTLSVDSTARLWDVSSNAVVGRPILHVRSAVFADNSERFIALTNSGAQVWDATTGKAVGEPMWPQTKLQSAILSADTSRALLISEDSTARLWDLATGDAVGEAIHHSDAINCAVFSPNGTHVLTASADGTAQLWDGMTGLPVGDVMRHGDAVVSADFNRGGTRILTTSHDSEARLWNASTGKAVGGWMECEVLTKFACFSPDGARVLTVPDEKTVRLWDASTGNAIGKPMDQEQQLESAVFSPDGKRILTTAGNTIAMWDVATCDIIGTPLQFEYPWGLNALFSPNGGQFVSYTDLDSPFYDALPLRFWNTATFIQEGTLRLAQSNSYFAFTSDSRYLISGDTWEPMFHRPAPIRIWDVNAVCHAAPHYAIEVGVEAPNMDEFMNSTGTRFHYESDGLSVSYEGPGARRKGADYLQTTFELEPKPTLSPDGTRLAVPVGFDTVLPIYDVATGRVQSTCRGHENGITAAIFSPDGLRIATASKDKTVHVFDATSGEQLAVLKGHGAKVTNMKFSPDSRTIVVGSNDGTVGLWDANSGICMNTLSDHGGAVSTIDFNPDGTMLVLGLSIGNVEIWHWHDAKRICVLPLHDGPLQDVLFVGNDWLWTRSSSGTARSLVWQAAALQTLLGKKELGQIAERDQPGMARVLFDWLRSNYNKPGVHVFHWNTILGDATTLAVSADLSRVAVGTREGTVRILIPPPDTTQTETELPRELLVLREFDKPIEYLKFTPDGRRLVAAAGTIVHVWDAGPPDVWGSESLTEE